MSLHENLESGKVVDQASINKMLIKGILKGIACHDTNRKEYDSKIEIMKTEHKTEKCRIECLETWVNKQNEISKNLGREVNQESSKNELKL